MVMELIGEEPETPIDCPVLVTDRLVMRPPHVDDLPVWSLWCIRVRPGHRKQGISHALLAGAVDYARSNGAPAIEGYPVDNGDRRVNATMVAA